VVSGSILVSGFNRNRSCFEVSGADSVSLLAVQNSQTQHESFRVFQKLYQKHLKQYSVLTDQDSAIQPICEKDDCEQFLCLRHRIMSRKQGPFSFGISFNAKLTPILKAS
jgi:hypothetical protein